MLPTREGRLAWAEQPQLLGLSPLKKNSEEVNLKYRRKGNIRFKSLTSQGGAVILPLEPGGHTN